MATAGINIPSDDVTAGVDAKGFGAGSAGEFNRSETPPAQQKAIGHLIGTHVRSHDVAARIDPPASRVDSAGEINFGEGLLSKNV